MVIFFGLIASFFIIMISLSVQRDNIVLYSSLTSIATMIQYFLLSEYTTTLLAGITLLYGLIIFFEKNKPILKSPLIPFIVCIIYTMIYIANNGIRFEVGFLSYIASILGIVLMSVHHQIAVKQVMLLNGVTWVIYQSMVGAYGQLPGEVFYLTGVITSLAMLYKARKKNIPLSQVPNINELLFSRLKDRKSKDILPRIV